MPRPGGRIEGGAAGVRGRCWDRCWYTCEFNLIYAHKRSRSFPEPVLSKRTSAEQH